MALTQQSSKWARSSPTIRVGVLGVLVTFLLVLPLALAPRADAYVYWNSENGIGRANLDGTGVKKGFIKLAHVADIAVNDRHIYWTRWRWTRATSTGRPCGGIRARAPR